MSLRKAQASIDSQLSEALQIKELKAELWLQNLSEAQELKVLSTPYKEYFGGEKQDQFTVDAWIHNTRLLWIKLQIIKKEATKTKHLFHTSDRAIVFQQLEKQISDFQLPQSLVITNINDIFKKRDKDSVSYFEAASQIQLTLTHVIYSLYRQSQSDYEKEFRGAIPKADKPIKGASTKKFIVENEAILRTAIKGYADWLNQIRGNAYQRYCLETGNHDFKHHHDTLLAKQRLSSGSDSDQSRSTPSPVDSDKSDSSRSSKEPTTAEKKSIGKDLSDSQDSDTKSSNGDSGPDSAESEELHLQIALLKATLEESVKREAELRTGLESERKVNDQLIEQCTVLKSAKQKLESEAKLREEIIVSHEAEITTLRTKPKPNLKAEDHRGLMSEYYEYQEFKRKNGNPIRLLQTERLTRAQNGEEKNKLIFANAALENKLEILQEELKAAQIEREAFAKQAASLSAETKEKERMLATSSPQVVEALQREKGILVEEKAFLIKQLEEQKKDADRLQEFVKKTSAGVTDAELKNLNTDLQQKIRRQNDEIIALQTRLAKLDRDIDVEKRKAREEAVKEVKADMANVREEVLKYEDELAELRELNEQLQQQLTASKTVSQPLSISPVLDSDAIVSGAIQQQTSGSPISKLATLDADSGELAADVDSRDKVNLEEKKLEEKVNGTDFSKRVATREQIKTALKNPQYNWQDKQTVIAILRCYSALPKKHTHLLAFLSTYNKTDKDRVVEKVLKLLDGESAKFNALDLNSLSQGLLRDIIKKIMHAPELKNLKDCLIQKPTITAGKEREIKPGIERLIASASLH